MLKFRFRFQLFGEGGGEGDGGSPSAGEGTVGTTGEEVPAHIPERAKKMWKKAFPNGSPTQGATSPGKTEDNGGEPTYADLIKSDKYKADHQAYMEKAIGDRLKKYKGLEEQSEKMKGALSLIAGKYGLDASSETFMDDLAKKIEDDDEYYEQYAMEHDLTTEEAKNVVQMQRRLSVLEAEKAQAEKEKVMQQEIIRLRQNAERTKSIYPGFDLDAEMQDERFRQLCAATHGDTTAAYQAIHGQDLIRLNAQAAIQRAAANQAQTVAANRARPVENGNSSNASSVVDVDFSRMSLKQIREYADAQRRKR